MSWLDVQGKIYHCVECAAATRVEYEGGLRPTQVSDLVVWEQMDLAVRYGGADTGDYLHEEGLCCACVDALKLRESERSPAARIATLYAELAAQASALHQRAFEAMRDGATVDRAALREAYARRAGPSIARLGREIAAILARAACDEAGWPEDAEEALEASVSLFFPKDIGARESLNPLIEYEATIRQPTRRDVGTFFVSAALSRDQLEALRRAFEPEAVLAALDEAIETVAEQRRGW